MIRSEAERHRTAIAFWTKYLEDYHQTWDGKDAEERYLLETEGKILTPRESSRTLPIAIYKTSVVPALELRESEVRLQCCM